MKKGELVFIPLPAAGHIVSSLEIAKRLVTQDNRLSISILIIKMPNLNPPTTQSLLTSISGVERINFIEISEQHTNNKLDSNPTNTIKSMTSFLESIKPQVQEAINNLVNCFSNQPSSPKLAGLVVDMFFTTMIDVADEFGIPSYVFYTSGAGILKLMVHLETLSTEHNKDVTKYKDEQDEELVIQGFVNPIPVKVFPKMVFDKVSCPLFISQYTNMRRAKGILVNSFIELESTIIDLFPPIYSVGPIINPSPNQREKENESVMTWLDKQPRSSVVFLCFGSMGSFSEEQVKEIAIGLEQSGVRFLWSLRKKGQSLKSEDYTDFNEVLPREFFDRTTEIGKVIGWASQVNILGHSSIGGFVSHCGWNSILESFWFGVPIATWPLYAEQKVNAFVVVKELELAVEIKLDYMMSGEDGMMIVKGDEIEVGIRKLMEPNNNVIRERVKEISEKGKKALLEGGSSYSWLSRFVNDVIDNI
ncbi:hypothetical protein CsatB_015699 [Cannabis sativa]